MDSGNLIRGTAHAMLFASVLALAACGRKDEAPAPVAAPPAASTTPSGTSPFVIGGSTSGASSMPPAGSMTGTVQTTPVTTATK